MNFAPICAFEEFQVTERDTGTKKILLDKITKDEITKTPFVFLQERTYDYDSTNKTAIGSYFLKDDASIAFFSKENMERLQKLIKEAVLLESHGKFKLEEDQDNDDLLIVMSAIYLQFSNNGLVEIDKQVTDLNKMVIDSITPGIITEVKQYFGYLRDINTPITPMKRPENVSNAGRKTLPSITTTW